MPHANDIVLVGQTTWSGVLAQGLARYCGLSVGVVGLDSPLDAVSIAQWSAIVRARTVVRVGFRPGSPGWRGRILDAVLSLACRIPPEARIVCYWIGSDVRATLDDFSAGRLTKRFARARDTWVHMAGSEPLARDLATVGVEAHVADFPWLVEAPSATVPPLPAAFTVLTYVPDARASFYDGPSILEAARALPSVRFLVTGGSGTWAHDVPANVEFLGWRDDMDELYAASSVVVRLPEYDSLGGTMLEGLLRGRTVLYSRPFEHAAHVEHGDTAALITALSALEQLHLAGELRANEDAAAWARDFCDPRARFTRLAQLLTCTHHETEE